MAANTKISYSVGLHVDTKQAKQDMADLMKSIASISDQAIMSFDTRQVKEGIEAARELERHLSKAFDVKTGNLDLSKFSSSIKQSNGSLEQLATKLQSFGPTGQASFNQLANAINNAQVPLKRTSTMVDNLMVNLKKTAQWQLSSTIIHGAQSQLSQAISYVKNLNTSLTNISIVSDLSSKQLANFAVEAQKMGKSLATSTLDVTNAALIYFQQGDSVLQAMEKAAITIKAANASANSSAAEMSEYLTAIWNSYQVGSKELEQYVDIMAALGAKTASSMEEIATAMQKVAATANTVGVGFDQMSSIISTVSSVTRESAESIGTSYKTILARIGDLKLGTLVEDGATVTLGQVSSQLKAIGINVLDAKGDMRDMGDVIEEIGFKWQGMNDAQKAAVAQTIAGKRQYTQLMALFENWDQYQNNMTIAGDSEGALDEMQEKWATGWEAASNRVRNSMEGIYSSLINDSVVTGFLNVIAEVISGVDSVIDKMGGLGSVVTLVGGLFATKLGGRTTEIIDALKTNLGLMTGSTKKQMVELNTEMERLAQKQASSSSSKADQIHYGAMATKSKARATYLKNQDRLSLEEREQFEAKSQRFDAMAKEKEQVEQDRAKLQRDNDTGKRLRSIEFNDSALLIPDTNTEEVANARSAADAAKAQVESAKAAVAEASAELATVQGEHETLQSQLDDLVNRAAQAEAERNAKLEEAAKQKDAGGQRGLLKQAQEKEDELTQLEAEIEAKKRELAASEERVKAAEAKRGAKAKEVKASSKEYKRASADLEKAKKTAKKDNSASKELKQMQKDLGKDLKPIKIPLDRFIKIQTGEMEGDMEEAARDLFEAMESSLLDSARKANVGQQIGNLITGKLNDIDATIKMSLNDEQLAAETTAARQALQDLKAQAEASGFTINMDITGEETLEQTRAKMAELQTQMQTMTTEAGTTATAVATAMQKFNVSEESVKTIMATGDAMGEAEGKAIELGDSMSKLGKDMEGAAVPATTTLDAFTSIVGTAMSVVGAIQAVSGAFETLQDPDATGIEKVTAALAAMAAIVGVVTGAMSTYKVIDDYVINQQAKKLIGTQAQNMEEAKSIVLKNRNIAAAAKNVAATGAETAAENVNTGATAANNVVQTIALALKGPLGWAILATAAAIAIGTIAILANTSAQESLNEKTAQVTDSMAEQANAANKLKGDLQSLASILHNTSLSYEEQLSKINEVTSAYGVQATMLDVLSGNYERLESQMRSAALGEAMMIAADSTKTRELAESTAQTRVDNRTMHYTYDDYGNVISSWREDYLNDVNTKDTDSGWFHKSTANASLIQDSAWEAYDEVNGIWGAKRDDNLTGIIEKDLLSSGEHYNAEGQAWINLEEELNALGFTFDKKTAQLKEMEVGKGDAAGLYELLTTTDAFDGMDLAADSYTNTIIDQLKNDDFDKVLAARQNEEQMNLIPELLRNENFDFLNTDGTTATLDETMDLIKTTMGDNASLENLEFLADYMTGFGEYSETAQQISAMADLAKQSIAVNPEFVLAEGQTEDELAMDILQDLQGELGDDFTIDMLLKINPTDIQFDEKTGKYTIDEQAKELAQGIVNTETAREKQATLANAEKAATADIISKEDYATLQASGLFETDEELRAFAAKGAAERAALWEQMNADAVKAEIDGLQQQKEAATAALEEVEKEINTALTNLSDTVAEAAADDDPNGFLDKFAGLEGEALFTAISDERAMVQAQINKKQAAIDEYNSWDENTSDEDKAAWREKYGVTGDDSEWISKAEDEIQGLTSEVETYNEVMAEAEAAYNKKAYNQSVLDSAEDAIDQAEYWEEVGSKIEKASKGAETYANAIGKLGDMDADDLAWMQVQDENALNNYRTMTDDEWNKYAYEQSMQYYDDLMSMYDEDSIEYVMALEAKEQATQDYYDGLAEKAETAAEIQQQEWEDAMSAADQAMSSSQSFMSGDMSFSNIETLKQNLIDAGVEVERVAELIDGLQNAGGDTEQIKAAMVAASEAALAKLGTLNEKKQEYTGLVTNLDTSPIEPIDLEVGATTEEVNDETVEAARTEWETPIETTFETPDDSAVVSAVKGWGTDNQTVTFKKPDGSVVTDVIDSWSLDDQAVTFTTASGEVVSKEIESWNTDGQTVKFTTVDGNVVTSEIASWNTDGQTVTFSTVNGGLVTEAIDSWALDNKSITFTTVNGATVTTAIAEWNLDGQTLTVTSVNGETVTTAIDTWNFDGQSLTIATVDGQAVTTTMTGWALDGQKLTIATADGTAVTTMIEGFALDSQSMTLTLSNGETIKSDIASWAITNDKLTVKLANGVETTIAGEVAGWTTLENGNVKVTFADGTTQILEGKLAEMDLSTTVDVKLDVQKQAFNALIASLTDGLSTSAATKVSELVNKPIQEALAALTEETGSWYTLGIDKAIRWDDSDKAGIGMLVNSVLNLDGTQLAAAIQDGTVQQIYDALNKAIAQGDAETKKLAQELMNGLQNGLSSASGDWTAALKAAGLTDEMIAAFKAALGIQSPSRLTMALAPYLFDGLAVGIAEADANFNINDLEGVRRVIAEKFQTALQSALEDGQISAEEMAALGMDEKLAEHYNGILSMDGETQSEKFENYKASIGQKAVDDYIRAAGQQAYDDAIAHNDRVTKGMLVAGEEAEYINPKAAMIAAQQQARADSAELERIRQEAIDAFIAEFTGLTESTVANFDASFIKERKWLNEDSGMTDVQKSIMESAVQQALNQGGWSSIDEALREGEDQFIALVQQNLNESGRDIELEIESTWAELQDIWTEGLMKIYDEETELAEKTYELWKSTFDAIAKARLGLMDGKSILETMFGDEEGLSSIIETYLNQGKSMQEIITLLKNPEASVAFDPWDAENYHKSGPQRFLRRDENNNYTDTTVDQYNANVGTYVNGTLKDHLGEVIEDSITQDEIDAMAKSKDPAQLAFLEYLTSQGLVTKDDKGNYIRNEAMDETTLALDEVLSEIIRRLSLDTQEEVNAVLGDAAATQQSQLYQRAETLHQEGQQYASQNQADIDLLNKARDAKLKNENLETALTESEQRRLLELTGQTNLASVSLETLQTKAMELANAMATMAQQLGIAMAMVQSGQADSWTIDPTTGQITTSKTTYTDLDKDADIRGYDPSTVTTLYADDGTTVTGYRVATTTTTQVGQVQTNAQGQYSLDGGTTYQDPADVDDSIIDATAAPSTQTRSDKEARWNSYGIETSAMDETTEEIMGAAPGLTDGFATRLSTDREAAEEAAQSMLRYNKAIEDISANYETWIEDMDSTDFKKQQKAIKGLRKSFADMLNLDYDKLPENFEQNEKNLELMKEAAEGSSEAYNELQANVAIAMADAANGTETVSEALKNTIEEVSAIDSFEVGDLITFDSAPEVYGQLTGLFNQLVATAIAGGKSVDAAIQEANSIMNATGFKPPEMELKTVYVKGQLPAGQTAQEGPVTYDSFGIPYWGVDWREEPGDGYDTAISMWVPKGEQGFTKTAENVGTSQTPPPSGGGGGGGGSKEKKDKVTSEDVIERYHEIQEEMARTAEVLDQIGKLKERAYGANYLKLIDQETAKLRENIKEQERYQDEIAGYLAQDRQAVAALGATFDAEGNVSNYEQMMQAIMDEYNAAIEAYNNSEQDEGDKLALEDAEEKFNDAKEALEQYEETLALAGEAQADLLELQNQLSAAELEKITYKIEIVTELNDADLEILQYYQDTYEDNLDKQDDLMRNLTQQAQEYESNILVLNDAMADLQAKFAAGEINEADFAEGMQELRDQALGYAGDLEDLKDQVVEVYQNALDLAAEEVENFTEKMQDSADMMDTYISLTQLMGRGTNYRELEKFYDTQYKANLANLETQRAYVDSLEEQAAYFEEQMEKNGELTATEQEQYEALQDALREANSELASTTEAALSSLQAAYENSINAIFKELDANIAGTAGSLADLADQYAYYQEEQARYVSTAKELFEISKLNRSIEQSLEDATTDASKAKLKALQDEINYISEKNDLTEYDIEMMNLQYQLTLAQIALEEAQASKDTVRLTRDQDGNMAYQYTANQDKVNQAQQEYENVLQQINDLAANRVSELEQQCLDAEQQYLQSAQEILLDTTLTDEQRTKKLEELSQRYSETLLFIQGQYNNASQALTQNQQAVAEHYGQALVNSMGEASLQMNTVIGDMIGNAQNHIDAFNQAIESGSMGAWSEYMDGVKALTNASGLTYDNLIANADDYAKVADDANKAAQELIKTFDDSFEDINKATEQWDAHLATLEGVQKMYENIATSAQNTLEVLSGFTGAEGVGNTAAAIAALLGITPTNTSTEETEGVPDNLITAPRPPVTLQEEAQTMIEGWTDEYLDQIMQMYEEVQVRIGSNAIGEYAEAGSGTSAGGGRKWNDQIAIQEYQMIQQGLMEQLHNFYAAQDGFTHASGYGVAGGSTSSLEQHVEIKADFPNASNQEEIRMAFEELINLASQHVYSSASLSKNR